MEKTTKGGAAGQPPPGGAAPGPGNEPDTKSQSQNSPLPGASLPKGGGAIRGMGETFETNPTKGTASMKVPIACSPGRGGFQPSMALSYDSAFGNSPFGFGWSLDMDSITRKTSKRLPLYRDYQESDVFLLSGGEDLVPMLLPDGTRHEDKTTVPGYVIDRYRLRVEGLFRRVERWTNTATVGDIHWRVYTPDDTLHVYGRSENSRIHNPRAPEQIFSWLISDSRDWKGNAISFTYKAENGQGVDTTQYHQQNRGDVLDIRRTANRYIKSVKYGNTTSFLDPRSGQRLVFPTEEFLQDAGWMFEQVFDYGEHNAHPVTPREDSEWNYRPDAFSTFRPGFEVRTARLCRRVLMFHHFKDEKDVGMDCLVSSTTLLHRSPTPRGTNNRVYTILDAIQQSGHRRDASDPSGYLTRSKPPVNFSYSEPIIDDQLRAVSPAALENVPAGLASADVQWIDLFGEGISGILTKTDAGAWYYKRNISPISGSLQPDGSSTPEPMFDALEEVQGAPHNTNEASLQFADLTGDGRLSVVADRGGMGYYEQGPAEAWLPFQHFHLSTRSNLGDPKVGLLDMTGGGLLDLFIPDEGLWYPSLGTLGFSSPEPFSFEMPDNKHIVPTHLFQNDTLGTTHLADFTGDGLVDIVRITNGEICVWPNLGYGKFGACITMDNSPVFDSDELYDPKRLVLCDIDGSGTTDIIYLGGNLASVYFNESGNSWSDSTHLLSVQALPKQVDVTTADIHGNGTSCLIISSPLLADPFPMQYIDLMGSIKPHLLTRTDNNLGAATEITYSTSTKFYLQDRRDGRPWRSKLAFPVHVVETVTTVDYISRNRFTSRYAYHHGYYDAVEREFRGFGSVEKWDTEELSAVTGQDRVGDARAANLDPTYSLPPVRTKSWYHLGIPTGAAYQTEFFSDASAWKLGQETVPQDTTPPEQHDAYRALKGCLLRSEVYIEDAPPGSSDDMISKAATPLSAVDMNYTLIKLQARAGGNRSAVFFKSAREVLSYQYERNKDDPRIRHQIILESNEWGQTLREVAIGYGRRVADHDLPTQWDKDQQTASYITYSENKVTNAIDDVSKYPHSYRAPLSCETRGYELHGFSPSTAGGPFTFTQFHDGNFALLEGAEEIAYDAVPVLSTAQKRILNVTRTVYRSADLATLLPMGKMDVTGLIGQSFSLAFTHEMFDATYQKGGTPLFGNSDAVLTSVAGDGAGYVSSQMLMASGIFPNDDKYSGYWTNTARSFYSLVADPATEFSEAVANFYRPCRTQDIFGVTMSVAYDKYKLLVTETTDAVGNVVTVGERDENSGAILSTGNDYRVLQCFFLTDMNGNRAQVAFDALGSVVGAAAMGKRGHTEGDNLTGFIADLPDQVAADHLANPTVNPKDILQGASNRIIIDLFAFSRTRSSENPQPAVTYTLSRTVHESDLGPGELPEIHHGYQYTDGLGMIIQSKIQSKPGPVSARGSDGRIVLGPDGQPVLTDRASDPRWISSGWTIYNNKRLPVATFEPFFTDLHTFEFDTRAGVSPVYFFDPTGRSVAALSPNNSYVKSVFSAWSREDWDNHDTVELDPRTDSDVQQYMASYFSQRPDFQTWLQERMGKPLSDLERQAAEKTKTHGGTPSVSVVNSLGRPFLSIGWNKVSLEEHDLDGQEWKQYTRIESDIEGHGLVIRDANTDSGDSRGRIVETFKYDMIGATMIRKSMESGARIRLSTSQGKPLYSWDDRGHRVKTTYDKAGRLLFSSVLGDENAPAGPASDVVFGFCIYGDRHPRATELNLRGGVYLSADQAGITVNESKDFKNNLVVGTKRFNIEYKKTVDWSRLKSVVPLDMGFGAVLDESELQTALDSLLQAEAFKDSVTFDGLNRPVTVVAPNSDGHPTSTRFTYEIGDLVKVESNIRREMDASTGNLVWTPCINSLDWDARGLRQYISFGNGITTRYTYDKTGELTRILSTRQNTGPGSSQMVLQDISYTYDPSMTQTNISDAAQQTIYYNNAVVEASNAYTYDALYQLIRATGREHLGQPSGSPVPYGSDDAVRTGPQPGDGKAMGRYTEDYVYDRAGNMAKMQHRISDPSAPGHSWTRAFTYNEPSLLEPAKKSNRLSATTVSSLTENFTYDTHGNTTRMPHLGGSGASAPNMAWNFSDQPRQLDLGGGGMAYYCYDASGTRVRKVIERSATLTQERLYLGGALELYRVRSSVGGVQQLSLERETLHVFYGAERAAVVESRTIDVRGTDPAPERLLRFQLCSHLRSATVETDANGRILSYEEYAPYGSTTYAAADAALRGVPKRYRFTGQERDEESGLEYHGMRFYAPWLARWTGPDPGGAGADTLNVYEYCRSNPVVLLDPGGGAGGEGGAGIDGAKMTFLDYARLPEDQMPDWFKNWLKGRDAEKFVLQEEQRLAEGVPGAIVEKEVWIRKQAGRIFRGVKRLDIITQDKAIQVKWIRAQLNEAGELADSPAVERAIRAGIADAEEEIAAIAAHSRVPWNLRAISTWAKGGGKPKEFVLKIVVDEPGAVDQVRRAATEAAEAAKFTKGTIDVVKGTGASAGSLALRLVGRVALSGFGIGMGIYEMAHAESMSDKLLAGADILSGALTLFPATAPIGLMLGLGTVGVRLGMAAYEKWGPGSDKGPEQQPEQGPPEPEPELKPPPESESVLADPKSTPDPASQMPDPAPEKPEPPPPTPAPHPHRAAPAPPSQPSAPPTADPPSQTPAPVGKDFNCC
ncbi:virulence plasmid 65kDa B protein-domain-containing protein [Echria macrotheca]|uniref:Virulence plasmid 65kDa B protein-domain-containing protein n=1 Tax=Echria macrotheca TaxID=438768 RepID=A0AAJ0B2Z0_9PEZI|nr:virulence plasmid 65kDa B protein-domain-containing protein [Echria macrotheca]